MRGSFAVIDKEFLEILACPACKVAVRQEGQWLVCDKCDRHYPIRDGIPIMLLEEAKTSVEEDQDQSGGS